MGTRELPDEEFIPRIGRIPIRNLAPSQPENRWPATAFDGEVVPFQATVFREGHGELGVDLLLVSPDGHQTQHRMQPLAPGTDRWCALVQLEQLGEWHFRVQAYSDEWASWLRTAEIKLAAEQDVELVLSTGAQLLAARRAKALTELRELLVDGSVSAQDRFAAAKDARVTQALRSHPLAALATVSEQRTVRVERTRAGVGSWYEFFPRSEGAKLRKDGGWKSGTFRTATRRLPAVAAMGFDVVYLPPIHPIGRTHRKGPNNTLVAGEHDPGSPWAIGAEEGGHDAVHPDLGTLTDFRYFVATARKLGIEIALDLALQCSPDHPWVREHPEWFTTRPDGSIAYAENPPKKYQDIYPLNFDNDPHGLRTEILRVVEHWIAQGVGIFRVDNPHTKPLAFWEWLIARVNAAHPHVVFLAEAFTRPAMLHSLAEAGFQQSYSYFTWRNTKPELEEFLTDAAGDSADYLRPNLFVNTPDILTEYLQHGGRPAYKVRAAIAATAGASWGVYSGYELIENVARPGSEENIDNEKYQYTPRDWIAAERQGNSIGPYLSMLNRMRSRHPALRQLRNFRTHWADDDNVLVYSKYLPGRFVRSRRRDGVIVVANLDPHSVRETLVHLDLEALGLDPEAEFRVKDAVTGASWIWSRHSNYVRLDPDVEPVHILVVDYPKEVRP